jgi:hypothetical protein
MNRSCRLSTSLELLKHQFHLSFTGPFQVTAYLSCRISLHRIKGQIPAHLCISWCCHNTSSDPHAVNNIRVTMNKGAGEFSCMHAVRSRVFPGAVQLEMQGLQILGPEGWHGHEQV